MANSKYLDNEGLGIVWGKVKERDTKTLTAAQNDATSKVNAAKAELQGEINTVQGNVTTLQGYFTNGAAKKAIADKDGNAIDTSYVKNSEKGASNGVATLGADGKVPSSQLPSYVDDVIEGYYYNGNFYLDSAHQQLIPPEGGKIYVDLTDGSNKTYRWGGTVYVEISESLALGETAGTAYEGNKGKANADAIAVLQEDMNGLNDDLSSKVDKLYQGTNEVGRVSNTQEGTYIARTQGSTTNGGSVVVNTTSAFIQYTVGSTAKNILKVSGSGATFNDNQILDESMALTTEEINAICV